MTDVNVEPEHGGESDVENKPTSDMDKNDSAISDINSEPKVLATQSQDEMNCTLEQQPSTTTDPKLKDPCAKSTPNHVGDATNSSTQSNIYSTESQLQKAKRDLESMVIKYARSERENIVNKNKIEEIDRKLRRAIKDNDQLANRIKLLSNEKEQLGASLSAKVAKLTVLEQKNSSNAQAEKLKELETKISNLEHHNEDLLRQIESYKSKEGELLDFSERLSMKHMMLQSELDNIQRQVPDYKIQYDTAIEDKNKLLEENESLLEKLTAAKISLGDERKTVESLRKERNAIEIEFRKQLDQTLNEMTLMKRKHQLMIKEYMKKIKLLQAELAKHVPSSISCKDENIER